MKPARSLLVLRLSAFGDVLHTLPAVAALRASLPPETRIGWVIEQHLEELVRLVSPADEVFVVSTRTWRRRPLARETFAEISALRRRLREFAEGQTAVDFQGLVKSAAMGVMAGASDRYGFDAASVRERISILLTNRRVAVRPSHVVDLNMQLARAVGADGGPPPLDFSQFEADPSRRLAALATPRTVVLNPGAGNESKRWSVERFAQLANQLSEKFELEPLVIWGPGEEALAAQIAAGSVARMAPPTSLRELAFLLRRSHLFVSGDTGPLHLAAALGTAVVGLYGPTNPRRNGPYGQLDRCVERWSTTRSLESIGVSAVVEKVGEVLGRSS